MTIPSASVMPDGLLTRAAGLHIHDLGTLVVQVGDVETTFGSTKPGKVLAVLLVNANRRVSVDVLVDAVWGDADPESVVATLESHIWRLRKTTEPSRGRRQQPMYLVNDAGGYRLIVNPDNVDSLRFAQLSEQGDRLLATGEPDRALDRYELALRLWRGRPFDAVADEAWASAAIARLDELYGQLQEQRVEALLRLGAADRAVASLEELVARLPLRERLWGQLMTGLYQVGRLADALNAYQRARTVMVDALGLEPGDPLRELQRRILDQDPTLMPPPRPRSADAPAGRTVSTTTADTGGADIDGTAGARVEVTPPSLGDVHLPLRLSELIGREAELQRLGTLLAGSRLVTLVGTAGCGKTRLSIELARAAAGGAPDGVWFVDLTAVDDPAAVPGLVAATIGLEQPAIGTIESALRSYSMDRKILLVLDNCEHVLSGAYRVVESLLDSGSQARLLATSREPIGLDGEVLWTLPPLPTRDPAADESTDASPAARLFIARARQVDPTFSLADSVLEKIEAICRTVDGIPLAIELAAGRLRLASLDEIQQQVLTELGGLTRPGYAHNERYRTVESAIEWSARLLPDADRAVHAALAELPGVFTAEAACAVAADRGRPGGGSILDALDRLVHCSLLAVVPPHHAGQPTRFRQLATVHAHAGRLLTDTGEEDVVRSLRTAFVTDLVAAQPMPGSADRDGWHARIDDNHDTVAAVLADQLLDRPSPAGVRLIAQLSTYWFYRGRMIDGVRWLEAAQQVSDASAADRGLVDLALAYVHALRDRTDLSLPLVRAALDSPAATAARTGTHPIGPRGYAYGLVSAAWCVWVRQDPALDFVAGEVRQVANGDPVIELWADLLDVKNGLAVVGPATTARQAQQLVERGHQLGSVSAVWLAGWLDVLCCLLVGDPQSGRTRLRQVEACYRALGGTATANSVEFDANFAALAGDPIEAVRLFGTASRLAFRSGMRWPISPATEPVLAGVRRGLPSDQFDAAWQRGDRAAVAPASHS